METTFKEKLSPEALTDLLRLQIASFDSIPLIHFIYDMMYGVMSYVSLYALTRIRLGHIQFRIWLFFASLYYPLLSLEGNVAIDVQSVRSLFRRNRFRWFASFMCIYEVYFFFIESYLWVEFIDSLNWKLYLAHYKKQLFSILFYMYWKCLYLNFVRINSNKIWRDENYFVV